MVTKKKVLIFGTFDLFHKGHEYFITESKKHGEKLYVVVAKDSNVNRIKGFLPIKSEKERVDVIKNLGIAHKVFSGTRNNHYIFLSKIKPDIICIGYDQTAFVDKLEDEILARGLKTEIIKIPSYKPHRYKSSIFRKKILKKDLKKNSK